MIQYCKIIGQPKIEYLWVIDLIRYICKQKKVDIAINLTHKKKLGKPDCYSALDGIEARTVNYDLDSAIKNSYSNFRTVARERTIQLQKTEIWKGARFYSIGVSMLYDLLHEVGHVACHINNKGKKKIDFDKYNNDLSYRYDVEREVDKWAMDCIKEFCPSILLEKFDYRPKS